MRRGLDVVRGLVNSCSVPRSVFSLFSPSPPHWYRVPVTVFAPKLQTFSGYAGEKSRFQHLQVNGRMPAQDEQEETKRLWNDTLLASPGAISADKEGEYLFISDTHHHRVIITDGDGCVLDSIGSLSGMKDGSFDTARLCYPTSTVFDAEKNCLYIADSQNHAIRRADLTGRIVATVCPPKMVDCERSMWERFVGWIGNFGQSKSQASQLFREDEAGKAGALDSLRNPWHLKFTQHGSLLVASRCFESLWVVDSNSGKVNEAQSQGSEALLEEFLSKAVDSKELEDMHDLILNKMQGKELVPDNLSKMSSVIDFVSRAVRLRNSIFFVDTECQILLRYDMDTGSKGAVKLSNLGVLGLPWWWSLSLPHLEDTACLSSYQSEPKLKEDHERLYHSVHVQPGRCLLCINPILPSGMVLAAPVEDGSVWRQAKGSVVELSVFGGSLISHQVSGAQQWVDDLDDLDSESETDELTIPQPSETGLPLYLLLDTTLGSGEVSLDAVLHLRLSAFDMGIERQRVSEQEVVHWKEQVVLKHLHAKVRLEIADSAPAERTKHICIQM